ncbi:tetratricopeptide repeat protein 28 [Aplysia californica]|uniref:Tetratricopeptide repeat protein 28 n=1 Tax=Aplysia californica TaxID=6500 RepID=A0ABM0ZUG0_APLCA|nr:tetratricopeptide repeat protein 28 [Aplysia californica]
MPSRGTKVKEGQHAARASPSGPGPAHSPSPTSQTVYLQRLQDSSDAFKAGDFKRAVQLYTEALTLDPENHILLTNRAAAHLKLGQLEQSVADAVRARTICPKWGKAYLREGVALHELGRHGDSLAAFACGLGQEPANTQLLDGLLEAALNSPLKEKLEPTFLQLEKFGLKSSPFVIIAVIGQELVAAGHFSAAVTILEAALKVGTCSLKLRGSVFSALSSALWGLGQLDKAIYFMQQDMAVAKNLGDQEGECRAYGNLGSAYFTKGHYKESKANHRFQLVLAMKLKNRQVAASALGSLGHVYTAIGDYPNALASHKQCVLLLKQSREVLAEAREIGNVGAVYLAMGNFEDAVECHQEHLKIARSAKSNVEEARAYSNLGSAYHYKRDYQKAMLFHKEVLKIAEQNKDKTLEARAYAGLGHAARCSGDTLAAKAYHEKQLDNALQTKDKVAEGRACSNLGIIFHQLGEYEAALKLHKVHLKIAKALQDRASQGRAYGNIGNAYSALGKHELAVKQHKQELAISSEVNDRHSEGSTHGNLAVAFQALGETENALHHYLSHLSISRELKDLPSEARALCNLGNFHCARGNHSSAVSFYEQFLALSKELNDSEGESKACFNLGYVHFNLGNYSEAVRYYEQDLAFARDRKDRLALARAYCNLGLAHKSLQRFEDALECQKKCLRLMDALENTPGKLRALGNIGDLMLKVGDINEAIKIYQQQLTLAKQCDSPDLLATAYGALGSAHRMLGQYDKSLAYHTQELNIRQEMSDLRGECRAQGSVGNVHMSLGNFLTAYKYYQEMLERSKELGDHRLEGQACGNLGITKMNMGQYEDAIGLLEEQLAMLEQHYGPTTLQDKGKAFGNLGDCYEALGDYEEAVKWHEQCLIIAQQNNSLTDQDRAYRGLGNAHKAIGNLQQALVCFEKRLYVAHRTNSATAKASAYGELGCLHSLLGNLEQAIACLEHQLSLAGEMGEATCQGDAACGLGGVYQQMGEYDTALTYHQMDLRIAEETNNTACQCRAYGNLGLSYESLGNLEEAVRHQEQHLSIAAQMKDGVAKTLAFSSLGRVHHALGHHTQAVQYLQQGLQIAEQLRRREDEAKIRHRLGLALWAAGDLDLCQQQLHRAADLFETIRRESQCSSEYRLSLFDLQTACYQTLQRVLVSLDRHDEALVVAERACTRAFIDLLLERQAGSAGLFNGTTMDLTPISTEQITSTVAAQNSFVLCFSIASGHLYSWLLTPKQGIVKFHSTRLSDLESDSESGDTQSLVSVSGLSLLDQCVGQVRESMGIESHISTTATGHRSSTLLCGHEYSDTDSEADDVFQLQLEELGDRLNADTDRTGFLAMLNRSHNLGASSYSLGSVLSAVSSNSAGNINSSSSNNNNNNNNNSSSGNGSTTNNVSSSHNTMGNVSSGSNLTVGGAKGGTFSGGGSMGSMRSLGVASNASGSVRSLNRRFSLRSKFGNGKSPLALLYQFLIEPMEAAIADLKEAESITSAGSGGGMGGASDTIDLVLVLQGDLYLIPFLMLRREQAESFLFEKYTTIIVPSISALQNSQNTDTRGRSIIQSSGALVVGNPRLTPIICQHWHLQEIPGAEFEARILGELLTCRPLIGPEATKGAVLHQIEQVEVIHFATHISWKLSSIVLSPGEFLSSPSQHFPIVDSEDSSSDLGMMGGPSLSEYLLTAADILNLKLRAKLVVLNSGYTDDRAGRVNTDGVVGLTRALLSAGAQCVLFSLWPVPDPASKLLMKTLYTSLLDGVKVTRALSKAVKTVQTTAQFSHPSNWGGWVLVGADVTLSSKVALMGHALGQIVEAHGTCRQTLKVLLHLVEKSLQRIQQGCRNSMFTTQQSIENKVGQVAGWKDLLQAVGFRFEPSTGGLPPAVFFPQSDPNERLTQASASLQAFLGLPTSSVSAMSKFVVNFDVGEALIQVLREILSKLSARESGIDVCVDVRLWGVSGCHEFLASLGLDLVDVGSDKVTLRLSKQAVRRHLQFALQALVSVFDTQEAPRSLHLDTSSSMESLSSTQSGGPSSSSFSKSSVTPPTSPHSRGKRSLFNPAEMEKVKNAHRNALMMQGSLSGRQLDGSLSRSSTSDQSTPSASPRSPQSPQLDPALQLSHQNRIRSLYPYDTTTARSASLCSPCQMDSNSDSNRDSPNFSGNYPSNGDSPRVVASDGVGGDVDRSVGDRLESVSSTDSRGSAVRYGGSLASSVSEADADFVDSPREDATAGNSFRETSRQLSGSLRNSQKSRNGSSSQSESAPKSVTFAENLISEEISFDPSSPRLDYSGSEDGGGSASSDLPPLPPRQQRYHDNVEETSVEELVKEHGEEEAEEEEHEEKDTGVKTAGQLREHFERMSKQNVQTSSPLMKNKSSPSSSGPSLSSRKPARDSGADDVTSENVALKVLADVANQRTAVEMMQFQNLIQTQEANRRFREERGVPEPRPVPAQRKSFTSQSNSSSSKSESSFSTPPSVPSLSNSAETSVHSSVSSSSSLPFYSGPDSEPVFVRQTANLPNPTQPGASHVKPPATAHRTVKPPDHFMHTPVASEKPVPPASKPSPMTYQPISPHASPQLPPSRKPTLPTRGSQSAYNALFPQGVGPKPPSPRISFSSFASPSPDTTPSPSMPTRLSHHGSLLGAGSGENSISSDNSEGAESNLQSSVSSGYHSENGGFLRSSKTKSLPPPSRLDQDRGVYTQEFVNRTSSFTYSSGSSSPFSRASNDEMSGPDGVTNHNNPLGPTNPLSNVLFPSQHTPSSAPRHISPSSNPSYNLRKSSTNSNLSEGYSSEAEGRASGIGGSNSSLSSQSLTPPVPLVRTNALQSRPESSNSMSSQYSTSSSTLSTIYRPLGARDSPKVREQRSPAPNNSSNNNNNNNARNISHSPSVSNNKSSPYPQNNIHHRPVWNSTNSSSLGNSLPYSPGQTANESAPYPPHSRPTSYNGGNSNNNANSSSSSSGGTNRGSDTNPRYYAPVSFDPKQQQQQQPSRSVGGNSYIAQNREDPNAWNSALNSGGFSQTANTYSSAPGVIPLQNRASSSGQGQAQYKGQRRDGGGQYRGLAPGQEQGGPVSRSQQQEVRGKGPPSYVLHSSKC